MQLGDNIAKATTMLGLQPCDGCKKRAKKA